MVLVAHIVRRALAGDASNFVRRALAADATKTLMKRTVSDHKEPLSEDDLVRLATTAIPIVVTAVFFSILLASIEYTLKNVVAPLAMIETPSAAPGRIVLTTSDIKLPADASDKESAALLDDIEAVPRLTTTPAKTITSSIRGTIDHIRGIGGKCARWHGLTYGMLYTACFVFVSYAFQDVFARFPLSEFIVVGATAATLAPLHAAWTNKVITMPGHKGFKERLAVKQWHLLALPAAVASLSELVALYASSMAAFVLSLSFSPVDTNKPSAMVIAQAIGSLLAALFVFFVSWMLIVLPARTTQIRIEASLIAEDEETIVPFDRTFGGKVFDRAAGFFEAWTSFDRAARVRLVKLYLKITAIIVTLTVVMAHALAFLTFILMGKEMGQLVKMGQDEGVF